MVCSWDLQKKGQMLFTFPQGRDFGDTWVASPVPYTPGLEVCACPPSTVEAETKDQKLTVMLSYLNKFGANLDYMRWGQAAGREKRQDGAKGIQREAGMEPEVGGARGVWNKRRAGKQEGKG